MRISTLCLTLAASLLTAQSAFAAKLSCEDLKAQITKRVEGKGVKNYRFEVVATDAREDGKVVGTCEGGSKKLIYRKG